MGWFYTHCVIAIVILIADATGKLEPAIKQIEQKLGIPVYYAPSDSVDMEIDNPYPIEDIPQQDTFNIQRENDK
tara:strand:+ start:1010 stop:1231 length:222 start_codon:yes stop_codon:yes gene_type:complete